MFMIYRDSKSVAPLQQSWEQADEALQNDILLATRRIDEALHFDPQEKGEGRGGNARILFQAPLAVTFEVDEEKKLVRVLRAWVWTVKSRKKGRVD